MTASLAAHAEIQHATLTKTDQKRLERLAASAGRTPQAMLRFVLRDGFAVCEKDVNESIAADRDFSQRESVRHASVMQAAKKQIKSALKRA